MTPDTCIIQDPNSANLNSARHGQFQEKEKNADYWFEYFPFEKEFTTKNNRIIPAFLLPAVWLNRRKKWKEQAMAIEDGAITATNESIGFIKFLNHFFSLMVILSAYLYDICEEFNKRNQQLMIISSEKWTFGSFKMKFYVSSSYIHVISSTPGKSIAFKSYSGNFSTWVSQYMQLVRFFS